MSLPWAVHLTMSDPSMKAALEAKRKKLELLKKKREERKKLKELAEKERVGTRLGCWSAVLCWACCVAVAPVALDIYVDRSRGWGMRGGTA